MTIKAAIAILLVLLPAAGCLGQQPFLGLRAGISTRPEVERALGRPVKQVSPTLVEYAPKQLRLKADNKSISSGKIYVQYRGGSAAAVVERIEMILCGRTALLKSDEACDIVALHREFDPTIENWGGTFDALITTSEENGFTMIRYFGAPRYMVRTDIHRTGADGATVEGRWAFYSPELYESMAPTGSCLGTFWGSWETEWGRMTITRTDAGKFRSTYAENNGVVTGVIENGKALDGEWKDSTGGGTISLSLLPLSSGLTITGRWTRTTGSGPKSGQWSGRCVETQTDTVR